MALEPVKFFVNIELLRDQRQLGFKARRIGIHIQLVNSFLLFRPDSREDFRHALPNPPGNFQGVRQARFDHLPDSLAFTAAHRGHRRERSINDLQCLRQ